MYYLYYLQSLETPKYYIGITKNKSLRMNSHRHSAKSGKKSPLYSAMRKYTFYMIQIEEYSSFEEVKKAERDSISLARKQGKLILNLADGGEGGYVIPESSKEAWKTKLSAARQGRKPALGMKHTEENKKFFSECNKRKIPKYPSTITTLSFKEAKQQYGISKTHYYRLLKRTKTNDLS